jgi:hypothetical protein
MLQWNYLKITNSELVSESWLLIKVYILSAVLNFISCKRKHNLRKIQCTDDNYNGYSFLLNTVLFFRVSTKNAVTILNRISKAVTGWSKERSSMCPSVWIWPRIGGHGCWFPTRVSLQSVLRFSRFLLHWEDTFSFTFVSALFMKHTYPASG